MPRRPGQTMISLVCRILQGQLVCETPRFYKSLWLILNAYRDQLFFIALARIWAFNMQTAAAVQQVRTDAHSPAKYRVQGVLSNIPEFAKAFNCPVGSTVSGRWHLIMKVTDRRVIQMNPKKKCTLWE